MEKLVLSVIAVIALHITFVLYMADVMSIGQNKETVRTGPARMAPGPVEKPAVETDLPGSVAPPAAENTSDSVIARHSDPVRARTARPSPAAGLESKGQKQTRLSSFGRTIPAFALRSSQKAESSERLFRDRVIYYKKAKPIREEPTLATVFPPVDDNNTAPKPKKSLVAKLQYVYKKPWDLIKAVGSKLR
jgi:hypothetical protein